MYKVIKSVMLALGTMTCAMTVILKHFTNRFQHSVPPNSKANIKVFIQCDIKLLSLSVEKTEFQKTERKYIWLFHYKREWINQIHILLHYNDTSVCLLLLQTYFHKLSYTSFLNFQEFPEGISWFLEFPGPEKCVIFLEFSGVSRKLATLFIESYLCCKKQDIILILIAVFKETLFLHGKIHGMPFFPKSVALDL